MNSLLLVFAFHSCILQPAIAEPNSEPIESYLESHELDELLAAHLREQIDAALPSAREPIAERLARVYARQFAAAETDEQRARLMLLSNSLLSQVPAARAEDLRIALIIARYAPAERIAEQHRLRLIGGPRTANAAETFADIIEQMRTLSVQLDARIRKEESKQRAARNRGRMGENEELARLTRIRSLAHYYAGWSGYYLGVLTNNPDHAHSAIAEFGWLLDSPEKSPTLERLPRALLRYDHIARSAIGVALCLGELGHAESALLWLDEVERMPTLPEALRPTIASRRLLVLGLAGRFQDLQGAAETTRKQADNGVLPIADARLLALLTLDALKAHPPSDKRRSAALRIARAALGDLVAHGQMPQVLDLLDRYGSLPLSGSGFIIDYVRAVEKYEQARTQQRARNESGQQPTAINAIATLYRSAATSFERALKADDAKRYPKEHAGCMVALGRCLFAAGDLRDAADWFIRARDEAPDAQRQEEAHWLAIVSLDMLVQGQKESDAAPERDDLARLFLERYPRSERAPMLLLRIVGVDLIAVTQAIEMLGEVPEGSPIHAAARRYQANLLYQSWRDTRGAGREVFARQFLTVSEPLLLLDAEGARAGNGSDRDRAVATLIVRTRQVLDVALGSNPPALAIGRRTLDMIDRMIHENGDSGVNYKGEMLYRRVQLALLDGHFEQAKAFSMQLEAADGRFAGAGLRLMFADVTRRAELSHEDAELLRTLVGTGQRLMAAEQTKSDDRSRARVREAVASAAARLWSIEHDPAMRTLAITLSREARAQGQAARSTLLRLAALLESEQTQDEAASVWLELMSTEQPGSLAWFEARYESLRLLAAVDSDRARVALAQHLVLYPSYEVQPWGAKIAQLADQLAAEDDSSDSPDTEPPG